MAVSTLVLVVAIALVGKASAKPEGCPVDSVSFDDSDEQSFLANRMVGVPKAAEFHKGVDTAHGSVTAADHSKPALLALNSVVQSRQFSNARLLLRAASVPATPSTSLLLLALDTDHDGRVSPAEIAAFAITQGMTAEAVSQEFSGFDANGDGFLDGGELSAVLVVEGGQHDGSQVDAAPVDPSRNALSQPASETSPTSSSTPASVSASSQFGGSGIAQATDPSRSVASQPAMQLSAQAPSPPAFSTRSNPPPAYTASPSADASRSSSQLARQSPSLASSAPDVVDNASLLGGAQATLAAEGASARQGAMAAVGARATAEIAHALAAEVEHLSVAVALERQAAELRANATAAATKLTERAAAAAATAAKAKADELLSMVQDLEDKAREAEAKAAGLRAAAAGDVAKGDELMRVANGAIGGAFATAPTPS
mmetsp:Transcript_76026/g.211262  ORF Transcript_76026/g.211262 Transcript_76026/m.211262 type:complete len:429 (-) Transcript_76026:154-1440(-)